MLGSKKINIVSSLLLVTLAAIMGGCSKYLDAAPNKSYVIPSTLKDFQALLDNYNNLNNVDMSVGEISADNYYLNYADWAALSDEGQRRMYIWEKDYFFQFNAADWRRPYAAVYYANTVLDNIDDVERNAANAMQWDNVLGQALFVRAKTYCQLTAAFTKAYNPVTAPTDMGIPLRTNSDFNIVTVRSSLAETYNTIIADLKTSAALLPVTPVHVMRPCKTAAYALLARTYLNIGNYDSSLRYADLCLQLKSNLLDFNSLTASATYPIPQFNAEVIYESFMPTPAPLNNSRAKIDSALYQSFASNDLRKTVFFKDNGNGSVGFKGSYEGGAAPFSGIAVDEVLLIRAESSARKNDKTNALNDLNTLLIKRYKTGLFVPVTAIDANDALDKILVERRKELLMRGLRWFDLKRLNFGGRNITIKRVLNQVTYTLPPNDLRYALPIPEDVIKLSNIQQNPR